MASLPLHVSDFSMSNFLGTLFDKDKPLPDCVLLLESPSLNFSGFPLQQFRLQGRPGATERPPRLGSETDSKMQRLHF